METKLRIFAILSWLLLYLVGLVIPFFWPGNTLPPGILNPTFVILSAGIILAFLSIHILVFTGQAQRGDLQILAICFTLYIMSTLPFVPNPVTWLRFLVICVPESW